MALQVWLSLNKDGADKNQGLANINITYTYDSAFVVRKMVYNYISAEKYFPRIDNILDIGVYSTALDAIAIAELYKLEW